ncbi:MAG: inositol monophosphatase [Hyphomicrobiales bacterium]|nr:inositol monophosphatase [Hyphomicrobiales bacterium]MCP4999704.1 inositol monophosphatase [Hyphomicrobiales bacterium]
MTHAEHTATLQEKLDYVCALAREVGLAARHRQESLGRDGLGVSAKGLQDFVTEVDQETEDIIRTRLSERFPEDGFIGEESGRSDARPGCWVVDPIDGTANFLRGLRHWGISIGYALHGEMVLGIIHDSPNDTIYSAIKGGGAWREDRKIVVSGTANPHEAMGILGVSRRTTFENYLSKLCVLEETGIEHRRIGSAAIGLVRMAEGSADFYYEAHLNCWDAAAGLVIAAEAGAIVKMPPVETFLREGGEVLCATPDLADKFWSILSDAVYS